MVEIGPAQVLDAVQHDELVSGLQALDRLDHLFKLRFLCLLLLLLSVSLIIALLGPAVQKPNHERLNQFDSRRSAAAGQEIRKDILHLSHHLLSIEIAGGRSPGLLRS